MSTPRYQVRTWDTDKQAFTPQAGVRCGPYSLWGLKWAMRKLQEIGYPCHRRGRGRQDNDFSVLIERLDAEARA